MKSLFIKFISAAFLAAVVAACSDGGSGVAGIGGSGYIATGSVTGFGSVFVNGVEFETGSATFEVEDNVNATQADLRIGMVVQVEGSINNDGVSGTATRIRYGDQLEGPIAGVLGSNLIETNLDGTAKSFRVMGTNVIVDAVNTSYKGTNFNFANIALNNVVEISGYYDQNNILHATYVELKAASFNPSSTVEIEGSITSLAGTIFTIRSVTINAAAPNILDVPGGLQNGIYVEVKGTYNINTNTITATEIEAEDIELNDDGSKVSIEGYITRYFSISDFDINGLPVNALGASFEPTTLQLSVGIKVEAEGIITNGILNATEVETRGGDAEIHATVTTIDTTSATFTLDAVSGGSTITVTTTSATTLEDDYLNVEPFRLLDLNNTDFVEVIGFETDINSVTATKVKRKNTGDIILQGYATLATGDAVGGGTITILGEIFSFDSSTEFQNENDIGMTDDQINALIARINSSPTLIKIKDEQGVTPGLAEEIDIED